MLSLSNQTKHEASQYEVLEIKNVSWSKIRSMNFLWCGSFSCKNKPLPRMWKIGVSGTVVLLVYFYVLYSCLLVHARPASPLRFRNGDMKVEVKPTVKLTHDEIHYREMKMRREASIIVIIILFFITAGMFFCCRYVPELIMDRWWLEYRMKLNNSDLFESIL